MQLAGLDRPTDYLFNSALIATRAYGTYRYTEKDAGALGRFIRKHRPVSRVGYADICAIIQRMTGYRPMLSRASSALEPGEQAMVVRLRSSLSDPTTKRDVRAADREDYEIGLLERLK